MARLRFHALESVQSRKIVQEIPPSLKVSDYFGCNVFGTEAMRAHLSSDTFEKIMSAVQHGEKIDLETANAVASAMKAWAMAKGATHYTHWFQPLTGATAEKHDAFFEPSSPDRVIEKFRGTALVQQEPDASSFPSGGIRNTFEARGYTAWDPTSPAFIMENAVGATLCIPTVFVSYTGEALDYKTPMLKALAFLDRAATSVCEYFGGDVAKVHATLGIEQEYFLVDKALFDARPDLLMAGRTVFGHTPAKGQQLEDHYFGSIPPRVHAFMAAFEIEALKLGIPVRTRHNEVAPGQYECAPSFEEANLAVDHNQLLMDVMDRVARKHDFMVLFHEKPFAGVNGSGKHNNWSLVTDTGKNLLAPGTKAKDNLRFLTFFVNIIKAVHDHADLLRASIASAGNEYRLGANEAPPSVMSVFIGTQLSSVLDELERNSKVKVSKGDNVYLKLGINKIPSILLDNTDRNRTSPFAFTGNKFEFRAVGSSANCASVMAVLNTAVAQQLIDFKADVDAALKKNVKKEVAIVNVLRGYIKETKKIRFEGNGYSKEWEKEAAARGLSNIKSAPLALDAFVSPSSRKLFVENGIFSERELEARHEIDLEGYIKKVQIESRVMGYLAVNHIIPAAIKYQNRLIENVRGLREIGLGEEEISLSIDAVRAISAHIRTIQENVEAMTEARKKANHTTDTRKRALAYSEKVKAFFETIRYSVDKLELMTDNETWPLVKYRELLFMR